jgi:hypothetical protein
MRVAWVVWEISPADDGTQVSAPNISICVSVDIGHSTIARTVFALVHGVP